MINKVLFLLILKTLLTPEPLAKYCQLCSKNLQNFIINAMFLKFFFDILYRSGQWRS